MSNGYRLGSLLLFLLLCALLSKIFMFMHFSYLNCRIQIVQGQVDMLGELAASQNSVGGKFAEFSRFM